MGTLFNQEPRRKYLNAEHALYLGQEVLEVSDQLCISFSESLDLFLALGKFQDYDVKDEQLSGFGELIRNYVEMCMSKQGFYK